MTQINTETLTWNRIDHFLPPENTCLFVRLIDEYLRIDFATCLWDGKKFLYWNLPGQGLELPAWVIPTHWAMSEAANKTWFRYRWSPNMEPQGKPSNPEQIL